MSEKRKGVKIYTPKAERTIETFQVSEFSIRTREGKKPSVVMSIAEGIIYAPLGAFSLSPALISQLRDVSVRVTSVTSTDVDDEGNLIVDKEGFPFQNVVDVRIGISDPTAKAVALGAMFAPT